MADLRIRASLDKTAYDKGLDAIKTSVKELNNSVQGLGSVGGIISGVFGGNLITGLFDKIVSSIREATHEEVQFSKAADAIGVKVKPLHEIVDVWEHFGGSIENVNTMFGRMQGSLEKFLSGAPDMAKAFGALGISREQAAKMSPEELFNTVSAAYGRAGGSGDVGVAAQKIFGRSINDPRNRRALLSYAAGERFGGRIAGIDIEDPGDETAIALQQSAGKSAKAGKGTKNLLARGWASFLTASNAEVAMANPVLAPTTLFLKKLFGVSKEDVSKEQAKREKETDDAKARNLEAINRAEQQRKDQAEALDEENKRHSKAQEDMRRDEIMNGMHAEKIQADSFQRRGLLVGGASVNDAAYSLGKQQVILQKEIGDTLKRMEGHLAEQNRHRQALENIKSRFDGMGEDPEVY